MPRSSAEKSVRSSPRLNGQGSEAQPEPSSRSSAEEQPSAAPSRARHRARRAASAKSASAATQPPSGGARLGDARDVGHVDEVAAGVGPLPGYPSRRGTSVRKLGESEVKIVERADRVATVVEPAHDLAEDGVGRSRPTCRATLSTRLIEPLLVVCGIGAEGSRGRIAIVPRRFDWLRRTRARSGRTWLSTAAAG